MENLSKDTLSRKHDSVLEKAQFAVYGEEYRRDYNFYARALDLHRINLTGKNLDIGAGSAIFAKEAKEKGIDIIALDPIYGLTDGLKILKTEGKKKYGTPAKNIEEYKKRKNWLPLAVGAIGNDLPFREEFFNTEICLLSSFFYADSKKELNDNIEEALRVLKLDGKILIYPFLALEMKKEISVMNQWDINSSSNRRTSDFFAILDNLKQQGLVDYSIKYPENPPDEKDFKNAGYIEIIKQGKMGVLG